jgi:hypothetical protein
MDFPTTTEILSGLVGAGVCALLSGFSGLFRSDKKEPRVRDRATPDAGSRSSSPAEPYRTNAFEGVERDEEDERDAGDGEEDGEEEEGEEEEEDDEEDDEDYDEAWIYGPRSTCPRCGKKKIRHLGRGFDKHDYDILVGVAAVGRAGSVEWRRVRCDPRTLHPHLHFQCCLCGADWAEAAPEDYKTLTKR